MDWLRKQGRGIAEDGIFLVGLALATTGFTLIDASLGFIVPGVLLCSLIIWSRARTTAKTGENDGSS